MMFLRKPAKLAALFTMLALWAGLPDFASAAGNVPALRISLEPMGYAGMLPELLSSGSSVLTVNFVDNSHLLVTFGIRRLMKRDEVVVEGDDDRTIGAFLLELPSGKVLARTEWRLHDRGQYLWALGHGRFILRVKDQLTLLSPLTALAESKPDAAFQEFPFLKFDRRILAIMVSADDDLLTLETVDRRPAGQPRIENSSETAAVNAAPVQINFYRMSGAVQPADKLTIVSAGVVRSQVALALPLTTSGFVEVLEGGPNRWLLNFSSHAGKLTEMPEFPTTCYPHVTFVSHSEFVSFGCRGSSDKQNIAGFNVKGEEMWQQNFFNTHTLPTFAFAPAAGRFALGRTLVSSGDSIDLMDSSAAAVTGQEVRVYQTYSGKLLFQTDCTPVVKAGQNYALSPDGMQLAVMREKLVQHGATKFEDAYTSKTGVVEIYAMPPLTSKDQAALREEQAAAPQDTGIRIDQALSKTPAQGASSTASAPTAEKAPVEAPIPPADATQTIDQSPPPVASTALGDVQPTAERKRPTLYGPGEDPSSKPK